MDTSNSLTQHNSLKLRNKILYLKHVQGVIQENRFKHIALLKCDMIPHDRFIQAYGISRRICHTVYTYGTLTNPCEMSGIKQQCSVLVFIKISK